MIDLYVYYKVRAEHAARLAPLVRALQASLAVPGAQLKRRPLASAALQTWMEVYPGVPESFVQTLAAAAQAAQCAAWTEGPRRAEVFLEFPPCA